MKTFTVIVRTLLGQFIYQTIGANSTAVHLEALDQFGACGVTVKPAHTSLSKGAQ